MGTSYTRLAAWVNAWREVGRSGAELAQSTRCAFTSIYAATGCVVQARWARVVTTLAGSIASGILEKMPRTRGTAPAANAASELTWTAELALLSATLRLELAPSTTLALSRIRTTAAKCEETRRTGIVTCRTR